MQKLPKLSTPRHQEDFKMATWVDFKAIKAKREEPWPSVKYLRPGAKATGWVLLHNVPIWYELWRQFNGFQPTVSAPDTDNPTGQSERSSP